jgi:hypothetical protein
MFNLFSTSQEISESAQSERVGLTSAVGLTPSRLFTLSGGASEGPSSSLHLRRLIQLSSGTPSSKQKAKEMVQQLGEYEETRSLDDEEAKQLHKCKSALEEDSYGLLIMRILYWMDGTDSAVFWTHHGIDYEGSFRSQPKLALFHGFVVFILTVLTQVLVTAMLFYSSKAAMLPWTSFPQKHGMTINEASTQVSQALSSGTLNPDLLAECQTTWNIREIEVFPFILILWTAKMVPEFKMAKKSFREIGSVDLQHGEEPMLASDGCTVLRMTTALRMFLMISVPCVRMGVAVFLFIAGCDFICSQEKTGSVVLKGMCMWFVTDIDSIFLKAFSSEGAQRKLKSFRVMVTQEQNILGAVAHDIWDHGLAGLVYIAFVMICVCYQTGFFGYSRKVWQLDHTKAQLYHFRLVCHEFCSQNNSPCG